MDYGCTEERKAHGKVIIEPRSVTRGGIPNSYGHRVVHENFLDLLADKGYLGNGIDLRDRYEIGSKLRKLYYSFNRSGSCFGDIGGTGKNFHDYVRESEIGVGEDYLEAKYNAVMKALPKKYRTIVRYVCIEAPVNNIDYPVKTLLAIQDGLDALVGAFYRVERMK